MKTVISVIVPVYNVEIYLRDCIGSIVAQTYEDLEIILVDDGSTDASHQICDEYVIKDSRIKVIHKQNGGMSDARNAGLEIATGEFIGFVDSDDSILPEMYETLYNACIDHNAEIAICASMVVDENNKMIRHEFCIDNQMLLSAEAAVESLLMDVKCGPVVWNKLYKRELFSDIRYPVGVHYEDWIVTVQLLSKADVIYHVGKVLYIYHKRKGSITCRPFNQHSIDEIKQAEWVKEFVDEKYPRLRETALYSVYFKMGFCLLKAARCTNPEMREYLKEVNEYCIYYFPYVMNGKVSVKHKLWFCKNYFGLRLKIWWWNG